MSIGVNWLIPQFVKDTMARGLAPLARRAAHGGVFSQRGKQTRALYIFLLGMTIYTVLGRGSRPANPLVSVLAVGSRCRGSQPTAFYPQKC